MHRRFLTALLVGAGAASAFGQATTTTTTTSAQDLLKALQEAGVDLSALTTVNEDGTVTVKVPQAPDEAAKAAEKASEAADAAAKAAPPAEPAVKWDNKLTLAFGVASGNTENANVTALYAMTRETETSKLLYNASYFYSEDSGTESENRFSTGLTHDWLFKNSRWLIFADARYDYDEFNSWRHRVAAHLGPGYKLIDRDDLKLTLRAGAGAVKEWVSDNDGIRPEGLAGYDFEWKITGQQSLVSTFRYYPDFDDLGEFRTAGFAGWKLDIDKADGLSLSLGFIHEYQSQVDPGREHNDVKLFGGVTFDF